MSETPLWWFPFEVDRWLSSRRLRAVPRHCRSMYVDVLCELWKEGPLPDDEAFFCGLLGENPGTFRQHWPRLRGLLIALPDGRLTDRKLEEVRAAQLAKNALQAKRAKDGWAKRRADKGRQSPGDAAASPDEGRGYANKDLRSSFVGDARAHANPGVGLHPGARAASDAWVNAGIHGTIDGSQASALAEQLEALKLDPLKALKAWREILAGMRDARGVITKQTPERFLEHLRGGLVQQVLAGELNPQRLAELAQRSTRGGDTPARPRPSQRSADDVLREEEEDRQRTIERLRAQQATQ